MSVEDETSAGLPGQVLIEIPFPKKGAWVEEGQSLDFEIIPQGIARIKLYKSTDNRLHIFAQFTTWGERFVKADIPLSVPDVGVSTLSIRWADKKVVLWQDSQPAIELNWQFPH